MTCEPARFARQRATSPKAPSGQGAKTPPELKIAERCVLEDRYLKVRGRRRSYKIHLGSANILMEPNDQYLCIVRGWDRGWDRAAPGHKIRLPFEGDGMLSIILSKAFLLAGDDKITDPAILAQIDRPAR